MSDIMMKVIENPEEWNDSIKDCKLTYFIHEKMFIDDVTYEMTTLNSGVCDTYNEAVALAKKYLTNGINKFAAKGYQIRDIHEDETGGRFYFTTNTDAFYSCNILKLYLNRK